MNIKVSIDDLQNALNYVRPCVSGSGGDITSHYVFRTDDNGQTSVYSFSGKTFASTPLVGSTTDGNASFTVEAKRLDLWLKTLTTNITVDLSFDSDTSEVVAEAPRGRNVFQSLDPSTFPWWDNLLESSSETATVRADQLYGALQHARAFVCGEEHQMPHLCVVEARGGRLYSTDTTGAAFVEVPGLDNATIRIHGKDIGAAMAFLTQLGNDDVTIMETDKAQFFIHGGTTCFGESRPKDKFPELRINEEDFHEAWDMPTDEVNTAIRFLASGASWDDNRLGVTRDDSEGVTFSMTSTSGKQLIQQVDADFSPEVPTEDTYGFSVSHAHLLKLLNLCHNDRVEMRCKTVDKGGWVLVSEEPDPGFKKVTVLSYLRPTKATP